MMAVAYRGFPGLKVPRIEAVKVPVPKAGQLLIKADASAINPIDWKLRKGILGLLTPLAGISPIPGFDFVGHVVSTGEGSRRFQVGDRVFGMLNFKTMGSLADLIVADGVEVALAGDTLDDATLAGLPLAGMTALQSIRDLGQLQPTGRLLVIGGSGGVGHLGIQIGKALGAHVTAITGPHNVGFVKGLGADHVINYRERADIEGTYDVILDTVVSRPYRHWARFLSRNGTYVSVLPSPELLFRSVMTRNSSGKKVRIIGVKPSSRDLAWLRHLAEQGQLTLAVDSVYPRDQVAEALKRSQSGRARGKIIFFK